MPHEVFGGPAPLEAKAALISAIVNRAATGTQLKAKVSDLYDKWQREQQQQQEPKGLGGGSARGAPIGLSGLQRPLPQRPAGAGLGAQRRPSQGV
jgi:hypothetical protein